MARKFTWFLEKHEKYADLLTLYLLRFHKKPKIPSVLGIFEGHRWLMSTRIPLYKYHETDLVNVLIAL